MPYLQSNALETIVYDEAAHRLMAKFRASGDIMIYEEVPVEVYDSLLFADSIGAYFRDHIEGHYPARKV